jgi:hypothetical protein
MAQTMITKTTKWTYEEKEGKWYGVCLECKGEKAKYTPEVLKDKGIKPCSLCTNLETYNNHSANKEK